MNYTKKVLQGMAVFFAFSTLANIFGYLLRAYLGRQLEPEGFGLIYGIFAFFAFIALFVYLGFTESSVKFISDFRAGNNIKGVVRSATSVFFVEFIASVAVGVALFFAAPWIAAVYFKTAEATILIRINAVILMFTPLEAMCLAIFQAYQRPLYYSLMSFIRAVFLLSFTVLLFMLFPEIGIVAAMIPYLLVYAIIIPIYFPLIFRIIPNFSLRLKNFDWSLFKQIFRYSLPITLTTLSWTILTNTDSLMITYFRSLDEVGFYTSSLAIANILLFFATALSTVFFPLVAELWTKHKSVYLERTMTQAYTLIAIIIIPAAAVFIVFPDIMLNILFGGKFIEAAASLRVLAVSSILATFSLFNGAILSGIGKPQLMTGAVIGGAFFNLAGNWVLVPKMGFVGAAYATCIAQLFIMACNTYFVHKHIRFDFPYLNLLLTLIATAVFTVVISMLRVSLDLSIFPKLIVASLLGGAVYVVLILAFRVVTISELKQLFVQMKN